MHIKDNIDNIMIFINMLMLLKDNLSKKQFIDIINKFQFKSSYNHQRYLQTVSEMNVLYYILRNYNKEKTFVYEPRYNGKNNPECSFVVMNKTVNVEVKCTDLEKRIMSENRNTLHIFPAQRLPEHGVIIEELSSMIETRINSTKYEG